MITRRKYSKACKADSQRGTAIIMAMLILLVLSVIGVYAVSTSTVETKITGVEQGFQEAFYTADAGEPVGTYVTRQILHYDPHTTAELASALGTQFPSGAVSSTLYGSSGRLFSNTTRNLSEPQSGSASIDSAGYCTEIGLPAHVQLLVNIDRLHSQLLAGSGVEFASGYEGIGQGGGGSVAVLYGVDSVGKYGLRGADSRVYVGYRYVPGVAGGE